jgi:hypothetical protein
MNFETSSEYNSDKVNHDKTLQKYSKYYISTKKSKMNMETTTECISDKLNHGTTLKKYPKS